MNDLACPKNLPSYTETAQFLQENFSSELLAKQKQSEQELSESEIINHCLQTGDQIPRFSLLNIHKNFVDSETLLQNKPWLIITFYRGAWCPFCNLTLQYLQKSLKEFENAPANLVAISPQTPNKSLTTAQANKLSFEVLSDLDSKVAKQFKIVYTVPEYLTEVYARNGVDFQYFNGKGKIELPMPATYIVDNQGIIRKHFIEFSPMERLAPQAIIEFLKNEKKS
jgi:peroxiredoxin